MLTFLPNRNVFSLACGLFAALVALEYGEVRTAKTDEPASGHALTETETRQTSVVTIGPRELVCHRDNDAVRHGHLAAHAETRQRGLVLLSFRGLGEEH